MRKIVILLNLLISLSIPTLAQHSIAREWNEVTLAAIRKDLARPTVHARNLFHTAIAMYDAWAAYDSIASPYLLGNTVGNYSCTFTGVPQPMNVDTARKEAISYAAYRLLSHRFLEAQRFRGLTAISDQMESLGYDINYTDTDYTNGSAAALGNYIAAELIKLGLQDGSNEINAHNNTFYEPINEPMRVDEYEAFPSVNPNRWQPLSFPLFIDQSGQELNNTPSFLSPEWGKVLPFSLKESDLTIYERDGNEYWVYYDPGAPPFLRKEDPRSLMEAYKWNFSLVSLWSAQLDPSDGVAWDISPASIGNLPNLPHTLEEYQAFYDPFMGGDPGLGHDKNPYTGQPYVPQIVPRADYARVLAEFWADGPDSETPPGHWFTILNYVNDHPLLAKRFRGKGEVLDDLEWDVKAYFVLGGAMHDAAISAWGIKGYYDYTRPVSAIRYMGHMGQSSDPNLPNFDPEGFTLIPGFIELVETGDVLAGAGDKHVGKVKLFAWLGPDKIADPTEDIAGVGWVLAERWWPYQRPTFVTPPFAGYISGHSTYSRAAAEVMTLLTGDAFFPGGLGEFHAPKDTFLVFEKGPSVDLTLQWATYRDASDQTSLSRIWGGIHPPVDDIPGRIIGEKVGVEAFQYAESYFFVDADQDGAYLAEDCDDNNAAIYPQAKEICDGIDNNCNGLIDEGLAVMIYFKDEDEDGFGNPALALDTCLLSPPVGYVGNGADCDDTDASINPVDTENCAPIVDNCGVEVLITRFFRDEDEDNFGNAELFMDTCLMAPPIGYVTNDLDCDDQNVAIHPAATEVCDGVDNNCDGQVDEGMIWENYYQDADNDGYGDPEMVIASCLSAPPMGFVRDNTDCDDTDDRIYPLATDIPDNGIDEDCSGADLFLAFNIFPNPTAGEITIHIDYVGKLELKVYDYSGRFALKRQLLIEQNQAHVSLGSLSPGIYILELVNEGERLISGRVVRF